MHRLFRAARAMGIELPALGKIPFVVGVASGPHKARAIRGALCGHYVNLLVTDDLTARLVLWRDRGLPSTYRVKPGRGMGHH